MVLFVKVVLCVLDFSALYIVGKALHMLYEAVQELRRR